MIKTTRVHYNAGIMDSGLENELNKINDNAYSKILFVTSESYGNGEVGYTIIYEYDKPVWED